MSRAEDRATRRRAHYAGRARGGDPSRRVAAALDYLRQEMAHQPPSAARLAADVAVPWLLDLTDRMLRGELVDNHRR